MTVPRVTEGRVRLPTPSHFTGVPAMSLKRMQVLSTPGLPRGIAYDLM
jgi:hypothetical protein